MPEGLFAQLRNDPATKGLLDAVGGFAAAQAGRVATGVTDKMAGDTPTEGAVKGAVEAKDEGKSSLFGGIKGAIKGLFKRGGSAKRPTNIYEQLFIGVPIEQAYANWTEYSKFPEFMKGPESVKVSEEEGENGETKQTQQWTAKIFLNRRSWKATVEEDDPNHRIRWSTEAAKGTIDGVVTFHRISDTATLMVYVLEYRPKGFFEWWGNRNRVVGRRARLDVKHFGRYVMMQDQSQNEDIYHEDDDDLDEDDDNDGDPTDNDVQLNGGDDDATEVADDGDPDEGGDAEPEADEDAEGGREPEWEEPPGPRQPDKPKQPRHAPREPRQPRGSRE